MIFWGAAGHARVLRDIVGAGRVVAVFDRAAVPAPWDVPVFVGRDGFARWRAAGGNAPRFAMAIGGGRGADRLEIAAWLEDQGVMPETIRHTRAIVEPSAGIGAGSQILGGAFLGAGARIGAQVILNSGSSVDHDCVIGDGAHIAPGAVLCGEVTVGRCCFVGAGATILPKLRIGADAVIGAGAVVTRDVAPGARVVGLPARAS